jgi:hypothetical protein
MQSFRLQAPPQDKRNVIVSLEMLRRVPFCCLYLPAFHYAILLHSFSEFFRKLDVSVLRLLVARCRQDNKLRGPSPKLPRDNRLMRVIILALTFLSLRPSNHLE